MRDPQQQTTAGMMMIGPGMWYDTHIHGRWELELGHMYM
jgi:hypothetical protein